MNRILLASPYAPLFASSFASSFVLLLFFTLGLIACDPSTCASDNDCAIDSVCLVDADGPHCTAIALPQDATVADDVIDVEIVDEDIDAQSAIVLRGATTSFAPEARADTIVMRPLTVIVTRSPNATTPNTTRSKP